MKSMKKIEYFEERVEVQVEGASQQSPQYLNLSPEMSRVAKKTAIVLR